MSDLIMELRDTVSDRRGTFRARVMAGESADGRWEGWLEFVPTDRGTCAVYATPIETRQQNHATITLWASGLTHVYAEGALVRATPRQMPHAAELLFTLFELIEALDRRMPQIKTIGDADITADAQRLRACAMQRLALMRLPTQ